MTRVAAYAVEVALFVALLFVAQPSFAQSAKTEAQAIGLQKKAMDDYLQTDFNKAQTTLEKASKLCEVKCSAPLRARLFRDLGVVQIGGALDREKGIQNLVEAVKADPGVMLDPDVRTKELDAAFAEAKRRNGGAAPEPPPKPKGPGDQPTGDFQHTPAPSQQLRTPIPVYLEYGGATPLTRVVARYKGFGMASFQNVELKKIGDKGWGGVIPCADVQQGVMQYFLTGFDANNDPVATGGDRNNAYKVQVTIDKPADPPHLPNAAPPNQCTDSGDCPPNFPGCKQGKAEPTASAEGKEDGDLCEENKECRSNRCMSNKCVATADETHGAGKRFWFGLSGTWDLLSAVPGAQDVCKLQPTALPLNTDNYYCVDANGNDYPSRAPTSTQNNAIVSSANQGSDKVSSGVTPGNIRILLTADYALSANIMLGIRFGVVLLRYPGDAAGQDGNSFKPPIHLEGRFTYVVGKDAIWKKGLAGYFMGALGVAPFETEVPSVQAVEIPPGTIRRSLEAWHLSGPAFIAIGGGGRYALSPTFALLFGARANFAFGNSFSPSLGPEIGGQVGF